MRKFSITLCLIGIVSLITSVVILIKTQERFSIVEQHTQHTVHAVSTALIKYEQVLIAIERRQTLLENSFTHSEELHLTIARLQSYNHFRAPQSVFAQAEQH